MRIYTELSLGKTDPGLRQPEKPYDMAKAGEHAALIEGLGFDGVVAVETKDDPFMLLTLAAQASRRLALASAVAMAFPRAPYVMAMTAWRLQQLSRGRFTLGLGSQVKGHIVRRFGLDFSPVGPWMRDYIGAVRAIWDCWQNRTKLEFRSDHYQLDLMVPLFDPGPIEWPRIPIHLAAVNRYMCRVAGEVADGLRPHPVCTPRYIKDVMLPAAADGAARAGRDAGALEVAMKPLVATGPDDRTLAERTENVRARIAFYASTPAYRPCFEMWGLGDLAGHLSTLSRQQRWQEMPALVDDQMLDTFAVVGRHDEIAAKLVERYGGLLDQVGFSTVVESEEDAEALRKMIRTVQAG
jgi:probable F420-dependent oxidoreductase